MLSQIRAQLGTLRRAERRVAEVILANPDATLEQSTAALAQAAAVSEPTVIRFCRALGCQGYRDFKLKLAQDLVNRLRYARREVRSDDNPATLAGTVIDAAIASLTQVKQQLNSASLEQAIALLAAADRVEFYGLGGAGIVAQDAQLKFARLGLPAVAYADAHIHNVTASLLRAGGVVVAISNTGRSIDLLRSVEIALAHKASVIAITASGSPLAQQATVSLTIDIGTEGDSYGPIKARIAPMVVIDILAVGLALQRGPEVLEQLNAIETLLQHKFLAP